MSKELKNIDSVFKEGADGYELPFNEAAWAKMEQTLDAEFDKKTKSNKKGFLFLGLGFVIITIGFWYGINKKSHSKLIANKNSNQIDIQININKKSENPLSIENYELNISNSKKLIQNESKLDNKESKLTLNIADKKNNNYSNKNNELNLFNKKATINVNNHVKNLFVSDEKTGKVPIEKNETKLEQVINNKLNKNIKIPINASNSITESTQKNNPNKISDINKISNTIKSINASKIISNISINQLHSKYLPNFKALEEIALKEQETSNNLSVSNGITLLKIEPEIKLPNRWYIALTGGSNTSFSKTVCLDQTKTAFNFFVGYNFDNHFSIQTGLGYRNANFNAAKNQFRYKGPDWLGKYVVGNELDLSFFEIPIELKYQFSEIPNKGIFVTAGFRKLIYKKDNNKVKLDYGLGNIQFYDWNDNNTQTKFDLFHCSVGYQYPLNKKYTLTAQHDWQLPINYVGLGSTQMISTGIQIGIKYNLGFINYKK